MRPKALPDEAKAATCPLGGSVAMVTGASRGIGAAIAQELARAGAHVIIDYLKDVGAADAVLGGILSRRGSAETVACDVTDRAAVADTIRDIVARFGKLDILINNAGVVRDRSFAKLTEGDWSDVISVNLSGVVNTCSAALPHMLRRMYGRIVNISSFVAQAGNFGQANYAASKAGIIGLSRSLALEVASKGITVNVVCPGFIDTNMWRSIPAEIRERLVARIPMRRIGLPGDVARAVRFLVADCEYVTGQTINVNGGIYLG